MKAHTEHRATFGAIATSLVLALMLLCVWYVYVPGLHGDFLFDDFANLPALGATGPIDHWASFFRYITSGTADPTGRPLTLLSFLIDARNWPADPRPFKITNVQLHLLNGVLLCWVLLRLGQVLRMPEWRARFAALFGAGAWLLHPLFVSTTLYIVQREAMLPATFVLLGILGWMAGRAALARGQVVRGTIEMLWAAGGCTILATAAKANGTLLPLLLLIIEWLVLMPNEPMPLGVSKRRHQPATTVLLILPSAALVGSLLAKFPASIRNAAEIRDWSVAQRLLSEPRALGDYLGLLFAPRARSLGLFTDAFPVSTDWLHPWTTLPCVLLVFALIGTGLAVRKRHPAIALALLFYFAGQLLESTWIPLELYYEHRNYLPAMMLFWPIGIGLGVPGAYRWLRAGVATAILLWLASLTFQRASLWGDGYRQAQVWAALTPDSARAQASAAQYDLAHDRPRLAMARLRNALPQHPSDLQIPINLIAAECRLDALRPQTLNAVQHALETSKTGSDLIFKWFDTATDLASRHACRGFGFSTVQDMLDAMQQNPYWNREAGWRQNIDHQQGALYLAEHEYKQALHAFDRALAQYPKPDAALEQAALLGAHGKPELGLAHLDYYATLPSPPKPAFGMPSLHAWVLAKQHYWSGEIVRLRANLTADVAAKSDKPL